MLDPRRWPEAESLLDRALAEPPDRRAAFLAREVSDPALAEELALVIAEADRPDDFLPPGGAVSGPLFAAFGEADGDVDQDVAGFAAIVEERRALEAGQTLGPYRVDRAIGRGGMGEVYRARDVRLGRDVALKVLPSGAVVDATRRARVEREARTLAALSHPNIAAIHDLYEDPPVVALVLELIEGPTLAERLARESLPLETTMLIARQIVDAMAAAHERGIVHRDLKPSNIKVTNDGFVKVLDFGLARVISQSQRDVDEERTLLPSITTAAHGPGVVMGTAAYMSPEQASGRGADHRADIWAFGCILFEMLAGRRAFDGDTAGQVLARVIEREPDFSLLPASTPPALVRLVRRCLRKDPARRLGYIADARLDLDDQEIAAEAAQAASQAAAWQAGTSHVGGARAGVQAAATQAAAASLAPHPALSPTSGRGEIFKPLSLGRGVWGEGGTQAAAAQRDAEQAMAHGVMQGAAQPVPSHAAATGAVEAMDFRRGRVGRPRRIAIGAGLTIGALVAGAAAGALLMRSRARPPVPGVLRLAVPLPPGYDVIIGQLPALARSRDGRMLVYRARRDGVMRLFVRGLDDAQPRPLVGTEGVEGHAVSPDGQSVAYVRDGRLFRLAIAGDATGGSAVGTPVPICDAPGGATLDWGAGNVIVFSTGTNRHLMRVDASGGAATAVTTLDAARGDTAHTTPSLSPDGRTVAFTLAGRDGLKIAIASAAGTPGAGSTGNGGSRGSASGGDDASGGARGSDDAQGRAGSGSASSGDGKRARGESSGDGDVRILGDGRQPRFVGDDLLIFARQESVWAVKIDLRSGRFAGDAVQVLDGVAQAGVNGYVHFAPADDGSLVYVGQLAAADRGQPLVRLVWLDRAGKEVATEYEGRGVTRFAIAPDATRVAFSSSESVGRDVWVLDRVRRTRSRLTLDPDADTAPVWSPDSRRIAYRSDRRGGGIFIRAADGADDERRLTSAEGLYHTPYAFTPDGRRLLFVEFRDYKQQDVLGVRLDGAGSGSGSNSDTSASSGSGAGSGSGPGAGRIERVLTGPAAELRPALSPDGRWLAYQSDESGRFEVYVRPFPDVQRAKVQVSADGGTSPVWRADGRELFFASAGTLIAVDVPPSAGPTSGGRAGRGAATTSVRDSRGAGASPGDASSGGASSRNASDAAASGSAGAGDDVTFKFGALRRLFAIGGADDRLGPLFDVQPDGARVLVLREAGNSERLTVHLIQGWRGLVEQAVEKVSGDARESRR